jgi:hypothetical protein
MNETLFEERQIATWVMEAGLTQSHTVLIDYLNTQCVLLHKEGKMHKLVK